MRWKRRAPNIVSFETMPGFLTRCESCRVSRRMTELAAAISADLTPEDIAFLTAENLVAGSSASQCGRDGVSARPNLVAARLDGIARHLYAPASAQDAEIPVDDTRYLAFDCIFE